MKQGLRRNPGFLSPGDVVDGFRIVERLSSGGFGVVYHAVRNGRSYALKFALRQAASSPHDKKRTDERMQRELGCLVRLHHPNIVRAFSHARWPDLESGYFYIAMEYVKGDNLRGWAARSRPTLRQALRLFITLADALEAAHRQGILHRDLKPANILVRLTGEPVIVDWGAGDFVLSEPLTQEHLPPGTPAYRSPESLRSARLHGNDPQAPYEFQPTDDLYSLGVSLYEVLVGHSPFFHAAGERGRLDAEIELRVPTPPHHVHANIPPALSDVVMRLLAKDPRQRHATADALKRDLAHLDDGSAAWEALLPTPEGWEEAAPPAEPGPLRAGRASRRRWWGLGLAACVGAGALAASMRALWKQEASPRPPSQEASLTPARAPTSFPAPGLAPTPEPPPLPKLPPPSPGFVVPPAASEKDLPMKKSPAPPQVTAKRSSPASQLCLGASLALSVNAGCASVQTIPPKGDCPPAAVATMKGRGWRPIQGYDFIIDVHHTRSEGDGTFIPSGDVVGRIVQIEGTLFHGKLWWGDPTERIGHVRYTEAELPDGSKVPVCFAGILPWQPGSTPERPLFQGESAGTFKFRWDNDFP